MAENRKIDLPRVKDLNDLKDALAILYDDATRLGAPRDTLISLNDAIEALVDKGFKGV